MRCDVWAWDFGLPMGPATRCGALVFKRKTGCVICGLRVEQLERLGNIRQVFDFDSRSVHSALRALVFTARHRAAIEMTLFLNFALGFRLAL